MGVPVEHPGQRQRGHRQACGLRQLRQALLQAVVGLALGAIEAWQRPPEVVGGQRIHHGRLVGQEGPAQRAVGHKRNAERLGGGQYGLLGAALPQRIFALHGRHRVQCVGGAQALRAHLRQAHGRNLARAHQVPQGAHQVFEWHGRVAAVAVVQVDALHPQALQRCIAGLADVGGRVVDAPLVAAGLAHDAELGGHRDLRALAGGEFTQKAAQQGFVVAKPIGVGRVEVVHAQAVRHVQRGQRLCIVGLPVELAHAHAAQPQRVDLALPQRARQRVRVVGEIVWFGHMVPWGGGGCLQQRGGCSSCEHPPASASGLNALSGQAAQWPHHSTLCRTVGVEQSAPCPHPPTSSTCAPSWPWPSGAAFGARPGR